VEIHNALSNQPVSEWADARLEKFPDLSQTYINSTSLSYRAKFDTYAPLDLSDFTNGVYDHTQSIVLLR
jgi:hypothetical protein